MIKFLLLLSNEASTTASSNTTSTNVWSILSNFLSSARPYFLAGAIVLFLVILGIAIYEAAKAGFFKKFVKWLKSPQTSASLVSIFGIIFLIIFLGFINFLGYRTDKSLDLTKNKLYTLSTPTKKILKKLDRDVEIIGFFKSDSVGLRDNFVDLIERFKKYTHKLKVQIVDPDKEIALAKKYNLPRYDAIYVGSGEKHRWVYLINEKELIQAIYEVTATNTRIVAFLVGHREKDPDDTSESGLSWLKEALKQRNFQVEKLVLWGKKNLTKDNCTVLVVAGPEIEPAPQEAELIKKYLRSGGRAVFLLDPGGASFNSVLEDFGVKAEDTVVLDPKQALYVADFPIISEFRKVDTLFDGVNLVFFPDARSLKVTNASHAMVLFRASDRAWAEKDYKKAGMPKYDPDKDVKSPPIGVMIDYTDYINGTDVNIKAIVIGDSDFASNRFAFYGYQHGLTNAALIFNCISYLAERQELTGVEIKHPEISYVIFKPPYLKLIYQILFLLVIPASALIFGLILVTKRRSA